METIVTNTVLEGRGAAYEAKVTAVAKRLFGQQGRSDRLFMFFVCGDATTSREDLTQRAVDIKNDAIYEWGLGWETKLVEPKSIRDKKDWGSKGALHEASHDNGKYQWFAVCGTQGLARSVAERAFVKAIRLTVPKKGLRLSTESRFQPRIARTSNGLPIIYAGRRVSRAAVPVGVN